MTKFILGPRHSFGERLELTYRSNPRCSCTARGREPYRTPCARDIAAILVIDDKPVLRTLFRTALTGTRAPLPMCSYQMELTSITLWSRMAGAGGIESMRRRI
jgi:hypothetical protein